jgi:hypothetical protein
MPTTSTAGSAHKVSTRALRLMHSILSRSVIRGMAHDKAKRNVDAPCASPPGRLAARPSPLTWDQAERLVGAANGSSLHAYIVLSLLTGARTEEVPMNCAGPRPRWGCSATRARPSGVGSGST